MDCLDARTGDPCEGTVEPRSVDGVRAYERCERHFMVRLERQREINERYPFHAPSDFDPADAGERWEEDY